jgi:hypothetical protein
MVMEADWTGYRNIPWARWRKKNIMVARYSLTGVSEEDTRLALCEQADYLGTSYDYTTILGLVLRRFWKRTKNPLNNTKKYFCSESVIEFLNDCTVTVEKRPQDWTPRDVWELVKDSPRSFNREE